MDITDTSVRFKQERKRLGLNQGELATALHAAERTISRWETGAAIPSDKLADCAQLGFDIQYILTTVRSLNLQDVIRASMEDFGVSFDPIVKLSDGVDVALLQAVTAEVMNAIKLHTHLQDIEPEIIAEVISAIYDNYEVTGKKPRRDDPSILSAIQLALTG